MCFYLTGHHSSFYIFFLGFNDVHGLEPSLWVYKEWGKFNKGKKSLPGKEACQVKRALGYRSETRCVGLQVVMIGVKECKRMKQITQETWFANKTGLWAWQWNEPCWFTTGSFSTFFSHLSCSLSSFFLLKIWNSYGKDFKFMQCLRMKVFELLFLLKKMTARIKY